MLKKNFKEEKTEKWQVIEWRGKTATVALAFGALLLQLVAFFGASFSGAVLSDATAPTYSVWLSLPCATCLLWLLYTTLIHNPKISGLFTVISLAVGAAAAFFAGLYAWAVFKPWITAFVIGIAVAVLLAFAVFAAICGFQNKLFLSGVLGFCIFAEAVNVISILTVLKQHPYVAMDALYSNLSLGLLYGSMFWYVLKNKLNPLLTEQELQASNRVRDLKKQLAKGEITKQEYELRVKEVFEEI